MKTAVSLPNEVFEAAERFARERGLTRSAVYAQALEVFLETNQIDPLTEAINRVADRVDTRLVGFKTIARCDPRAPWMKSLVATCGGQTCPNLSAVNQGFASQF